MCITTCESCGGCLDCPAVLDGCNCISFDENCPVGHSLQVRQASNVIIGRLCNILTSDFVVSSIETKESANSREAKSGNPISSTPQAVTAPDLLAQVCNPQIGSEWTTDLALSILDFNRDP
jgi:hypothetical protein